MNNHVVLQGKLYITGLTVMRVERHGPADVDRRFSGYIVTGTAAEKAVHPIRISTHRRADDSIARWVEKRAEPEVGAEVFAEGKLMSVLDGQSYVLIEFIRFVGTADLELRQGNYPRRQVDKLGAQLLQGTSGRGGSQSTKT